MMNNDSQKAAPKEAVEKDKQWHYCPDVPVQLSPLFIWPFNIVKSFKWLANYWFVLSTVTFECALAIIIYWYFLPKMDVMQTLQIDWVLQIYARNLLLFVGIVGSLHLYLITFKKQGMTLKYDKRHQAANNGNFLFRSQVKDNIFWSIVSGVTLWSAYEVLYFWLAANGYVPLMSFAEHPIWFIVLLVLIPIWSSFHFYWIHRLLHWPPLYKAVHALHHRNINVGPFSGISMHPIEHILYFSTVLIHFIVISHPIHLIFHLLVQTINPTFSHSGFEYIVVKDKKAMKAGNFFHQLHHRYFDCNYGTIDMPWDAWFNSFHNGTYEATQQHRQKRSK